jgi:hypothetical protein
MKEFNVRYGVVNVKKRAKYEKKNQVPFSYTFITRNEQTAIRACRKKKDPNFIVERIFDTETIKNKREEIFRSGTYEDWKNEKNN